MTTHNGRIVVDLDTGGAIEGEIETHNGSVRLGLSDRAVTRVVARTHNGGISTKRSFQTDEHTRRHFDGTLGSPSTILRVTTHNGSITLNDVEE